MCVCVFQVCYQYIQGIISEGALREAVKAVFPSKPPAMVSRLISSATPTQGGVDHIRMLTPVSASQHTAIVNEVYSVYIMSGDGLLQDGASGRPSEVGLLLLDQLREESRAPTAQL